MMKLFASKVKNVLIVLSILLILGITVHIEKDRCNDGTDHLISLSVNEDLQFARILDINPAVLEELVPLSCFGKKTAKMIINKRVKIVKYHSLEDIRRGTFSKFPSHIHINS